MGNCGEKSVLLEIQFTRHSAMRFTGTIEAKADTKGRLFFPAVFRKLLQEEDAMQFVLKKDPYQTCLVLYPWRVWNERLDELRSRLNHWNPEHQQVLRCFMADVELVTLDANGRFLVPKRYQRMAAIEQDVVFLGMDDTVELWAKEQTMQSFVADEAFGSLLQTLMCKE